MLEKVTDPAKIVTDGVVIKELARQGIDKDYVEFSQDYAPRRLGGGRSPYAKFYRDLKSGKHFMVVSGLPMVKPDGQRIEVGFTPLVDTPAGKFRSKANLFSAIVEGKQVQIICLSDQPNGAKKDDQVTYRPQLFLDGVEIVNGEQPTLLAIDPINENYKENTLEWDYGICKRRIRIMQGRFRERWIFPADPNGDVRIKHNFIGSLKVRLGQYAINEDEELVPQAVFAQATYPFEIGATLTVYPDAHEETSSVDGRVLHSDAEGLTWAEITGAAGTAFNDDYIDLQLFYISSHGTSGWVNLYRFIVLFDTSSLPDDATITAATLSLYSEYKAENFTISIAADVNIYSSAPASNIALEAGDFDSLGTTPFSDTPITYADWNTTGYNDFVLNAAGLAAISKTSVSKFGTRNANYDVSGDEPDWEASKFSNIRAYTAEQGTGYKPKLVVTYTLPVTEKSSSDTGTGTDALSALSAALIKAETGAGVEAIVALLATLVKADAGTGVEALGSRLLGAAETGSGAEAIVARLIELVGDTGLGADFARKNYFPYTFPFYFYVPIDRTVSDTGSGLEELISRLIGLTDTGLGDDAHKELVAETKQLLLAPYAYTKAGTRIR